MKPEDKAELEAMGIKVSLGTQEEAERIALEQLGTGGSAQAVSDAITSKEEEG